MTIPSATSLRRLTALAGACLSLAMNADAASERMIFDFQTATNSPAWQVVNDDVMGGVSTSRFQVLTNRGAVFSEIGRAHV